MSVAEDYMVIKSRMLDYEVVFDNDISEILNVFISNSVYVIDKNVYNLYTNMFSKLPREMVYLVDAVESEKNIYSVIKLIDFLRKVGFKKNWNVLCFGGGITQDLACFTSCIYLRNVNWYYFPTTLLSMCDSCIGGKSGINCDNYKNQLGVFYPPVKVFIHTGFLSTLADDDWLNGWGEILKFALTETDEFFYLLAKNDQIKSFDDFSVIKNFIFRGLNVKKHIIEEDEFEGDRRRVLNYGHTFGHALEAYTNNSISHGKAVIWGIDVVNYYSLREGLIDDATYLKIKDLIKSRYLHNEIIISDPKRLFDIITTDKKVKNNAIHFVLLNRISNLIVYPMELNDELMKIFSDYLEATHEYYNN